jgi:3-(3-hydroxy-phenyl)propionate hydroxylase
MEQSNEAGTGHEVVLAGGGPTGMMLAAELAIAGVDVVIVEQRARAGVDGSRAGGLHARSIEVLDQRGVADRFLSQGQVAQVAGFGWIRLDISDFPTRHPYGLALWQRRLEEILADWIDELGVPIRRGQAVTGFEQDDAGVTIALADGDSLRAGYLVGCDGGRSGIRKAAGIEFVGWGPTASTLLAEVELAEEPEPGLRRDEKGIHSVGRTPEGLMRVLVREEALGGPEEPTLGDLSRALLSARGTDYGLRSASWLSRFTDATRQAATYRAGRVLLAGDAAHIHPPVGGQGLNIGLQDAVNLGWKLAQVVRGSAPDSLLDTYTAERHPVAARVIRGTLAQAPLIGGIDERIEALREVLGELLTMDEPRQRIAGRMSGLDVHYDLGTGHPLLGRRMPDLDLVTADGPTRVFALLHAARPVLLDLGEPGGLDAGPWADRLRLVEASTDGPWVLPVLGAVPAPAAVLIRPDGHVAWVGEGDGSGLVDALTRWFGPPSAA